MKRRAKAVDVMMSPHCKLPCNMATQRFTDHETLLETDGESSPECCRFRLNLSGIIPHTRMYEVKDDSTKEKTKRADTLLLQCDKGDFYVPFRKKGEPTQGHC